MHLSPDLFSAYGSSLIAMSMSFSLLWIHASIGCRVHGDRHLGR